jgi:hypothetical protein
LLAAIGEWSLALIGNASGKHSPGRQEYWP